MSCVCVYVIVCVEDAKMDFYTLYQGRRIVAKFLHMVKYGAVGIIASMLKVRDDNVSKMPYLTVLGYCKVYGGLGPYYPNEELPLLYPRKAYFGVFYTLCLR